MASISTGHEVSLHQTGGEDFRHDRDQGAPVEHRAFQCGCSYRKIRTAGAGGIDLTGFTFDGVAIDASKAGSQTIHVSVPHVPSGYVADATLSHIGSHPNASPFAVAYETAKPKCDLSEQFIFPIDKYELTLLPHFSHKKQSGAKLKQVSTANITGYHHRCMQ